MNALALTPSLFDFKTAKDSTHNIRTIEQDGAVWFVAKDVFATLDVNWAGVRSLALIPLAWRVVVKLTTRRKQGVVSDATPLQSQSQRGFGVQDVHCINFKAVCKIAFRSNKPEADNFTNWAAEVIETVLKTGQYDMIGQKYIQTTKEDRIGVKDAITRLVATSKAMNYSQAYKLIHTAFDVDGIEQIPKDKLHVVVTYVNGLVGEYIPYEKPKVIEVPQGGMIIDANQKQNILCALTHMLYVGDWWRKHGNTALRALNNDMAGRVAGHFMDGFGVSSVMGHTFNVNVDRIKDTSWDLSTR
jgi:prophage antirepressor-like protein